MCFWQQFLKNNTQKQYTNAPQFMMGLQPNKPIIQVENTFNTDNTADLEFFNMVMMRETEKVGSIFPTSGTSQKVRSFDLFLLTRACI